MSNKMSLVAGMFILAIAINGDTVRGQAQFFAQPVDQQPQLQQPQFQQGPYGTDPIPMAPIETAQPISDFMSGGMGGDFVLDTSQSQVVETPIIESCETPVATMPSKSAHTSIGVSGLLFDRGLGRNVDFASNTPGTLLSSDSTGDDILAGIDAQIARRRASGLGWEARYFGLYPSDDSTQIGINANTLLPGLSQLGANISGSDPAATVVGPTTADVFNAADTHVLTRQTELNNIEVNLLRNRGARFGATTSDILFGFRYFQFGETLLYEAVNIPEGGINNPTRAAYFSSVENQLSGLQLGTRSGYRFGNRMMIHLGLKGGVYNNSVSTRQRVEYTDRATGNTSNPRVAGGQLSGRNFDIGTGNDVKSLLGEADLGISYQISYRSRLRLGYRVIGVTDVAFASNQIQDDFTDNALLNPVTDGDLVMQGGYFGLEWAF